MKVLSAFTNRLGNRSSNQDRCLVLQRPGRVLLAVADGMGGHARGELAAQTAIDSLSRSFLGEHTAIATPEEFLKKALDIAHLETVEAGRASTPPVQPRTTCVVCLVQGDQAWWAHVGDSRLYLLRDGALLTRTRDHTPVEELLQHGVIEEHELSTHPLRNSVNRCLGGALKLPKISFGQAQLHTGDSLLLCSDGLWSALPEQRLTNLPASGDLESLLNELAEEAEKASYPRSDNISLVGLRWLSAAADSADADAAQKRPHAAGAAKEKDPLQQAIDDIHRAILDYASEMKE
jgi:serine/threonine protein phosphatase PrpC